MTRPFASRPHGRLVLGIVLALAPGACARRTASVPGLLRAFDEAVARKDAKAAYALLAPNVRASTDFEAFERRFVRLAESLARELETSRADHGAVPLLAVTTRHEDGRLLDWVASGGRAYLVSGLPTLPRTDTPAAAVRGFVAVLRHGPTPALGAVATPELVGRLEQDWEAKAAQIEAALADPSNLVLSADKARAVLRYGEGGAIRLVRTPAGWRVDAFE